jgi:hypothetical protein
MLIDSERKVSVSTSNGPSAGLERMASACSTAPRRPTAPTASPSSILAVPDRGHADRAPDHDRLDRDGVPDRRRLANDMREISACKLTVLTRDQQGNWLAGGSTLPDRGAGRGRSAAALPSLTGRARST